MKHSLKYAVSVVVLVAAFAASSVGADRKFEKKFSVSSGGTLTLTTDVGDVGFSGSSSGEVSIVADIRGRQRDVDEFEVSAWQNDSGVEVKGKSKRSHFFSWFDNDLEIRYTVKVPHDYNIRVTTSGGDITVADLKGSVQGETSGGDLTLRNVDGGIRLETSGGNIRAETLTGNIHMETSGGDIQVASIVGEVDVSTSGGNVRVSDVDGKIKAETSGGDVVIKARGENKGIHAETSGGDIDIVVPRMISATIDASTTGGEVTCDLPVTMSGRFDESRVRGTINGGGNAIRARTSGGDVRIRAAE